MVDATTVGKEQISHYHESFNSAAQGADTITKSQFDQIMQISGQQRREDDDDFAGLGISKRTMFSKIWKLFDVDKDGVMTVCSISYAQKRICLCFHVSVFSHVQWPEFLLCACFMSASKSNAMILSYFIVTDLDGNGTLSKKEIHEVFTKFLVTKKRQDKRHRAEGLTYEERKQLQDYTTEFIKVADKNNNGLIELEEFMAAWSLFGDRISAILSN